MDTLSKIIFKGRSIYSVLTLLCVLMLFASCSNTDDAQRDFENDAYRLPSGFTETDAQGNVINEDPDDWRVSPMFAGFVEIDRPAYPNPTTGPTISLEILITGIGSVNGIDVYTFDENDRLKLLWFDERMPLPVGFSQILIDPVQFAPGGSGTISGARGLHRVLVFDRRNNLITYGDIKVE